MRRIYTEVSLIVSLFAIACGPLTPSVQKTGRFMSATIDDRTSVEYSTVFSSAIDEMEAYENSDFLHGNTSNVMRITVEEDELIENRIGQATTYHSMQGRKCEILIDSTYFRTHRTEERRAMSLRLVFIHEVGHCFGLPHDETDDTAIMYPYSIVDLQSSLASFESFMFALKEVRQ